MPTWSAAPSTEVRVKLSFVIPVYANPVYANRPGQPEIPVTFDLFFPAIFQWFFSRPSFLDLFLSFFFFLLSFLLSLIFSLFFFLFSVFFFPFFLIDGRLRM